MKGWKKLCAIGAASLVLASAAGLGYLNYTLPDTFYLESGGSLSLESMPWLRPVRSAAPQLEAGAGGDTSSNTTLAVLGVLPVKTVRQVEQPRPEIQVCGTPFGIKIFSKGALVVGFSDVVTQSGSENPAKEAGICLGDLILSANGTPIRSNQDLSLVIGQAGGTPIQLECERSGQTFQTQLTPAKDPSVNRWRAGIWVRDSSAGIGTMTFYLPQTGAFGGLGHPITDNDTGEVVSVSQGRVAGVTITGYEKAAVGVPGQLKGEFDPMDLGSIQENGQVGVYGFLEQYPLAKEYPLAYAQEVTEGPAYIYTTVTGRRPALYRAEIEQVSLAGTRPNRDMIVTVTDPAILSVTGGILQGMSGSPILQNGKLVGAVTHVLVNDPASGYAIFAQTMVEKALAMEPEE